MSLPHIRALALDIDGTLLAPDHRIRPVVREAVRRAHEAGVIVILASARYPGAMRALQAELGLAGRLMVACQGASAGRYDEEGAFEAVDAHPIAAADAHAVLAAAAARNLPVSRFGAASWTVVADDPMAGQEAEIVGCEPHVVADLGAVAEPAHKLTVMAPSGRERELAGVAAALPPGVRGAISRADYLEVTRADVSKASALAALLAHLGLDRGQLAAAGDGANDAEMLGLAAVSMAMGHAPDALRALATWTLPTNADDGLAAGIARLFSDGLVA